MPESEVLDKKDNILATLPSEKRGEVASLVAERWRNSTEHLMHLFKDSDEAWDFYLQNQPKPSDVAGRPDKLGGYQKKSSARKGFRLGSIPKAVESILALQHNATFPPDDRFFKGTPRNDFSEQHQEVFEAFMAENFGESNVVEELRKYRLNLILDGTACLFTKWDQKITKNKKIYEPISIKLPTPAGPVKLEIPGTLRERTEDVVEWEGTHVEALDFTDWRVDPFARCMDESWFIRRWYLPVYKVKEMYPDIPKHKVTSYQQFWEDYGDNEKREAFGLPELTRSIEPDFEPDGHKSALLMVMYDDFVIGEKVYENHLAVVLNDNELVWFGPNPYNHGKLPYIVAPYNPVPGQIYGLSAVKHALPAAEVIDKATDIGLRVGSWAANPVFLKNIKDNAVKKHGSVQLTPGLLLPVERMDSYQQLQINLNNLPILQYYIDRAETTIQDITGSNPFVAGDAPTVGETTAFEIDQRVQGGNSRFQSIMSSFNNHVLEPLMVIAFENHKQFMSEEVKVNGKVLTPDMVKRMDFKWVITSTQATVTRNKNIANKKAMLFEIGPMLVQSGVAELKPQKIVIDQYFALMDFLNTAGVSNAEKIFKVEEGLPGFMTGDNPFGGEGDVNGVSEVPPTPNTAAIENAGSNIEKDVTG